MEVVGRNEVEEEEMEEDILEGVAELWGAKREELVTSSLSWFNFSLKLCGLNLIGGFGAKIKFT